MKINCKERRACVVGIKEGYVFRLVLDTRHSSF